MVTVVYLGHVHIEKYDIRQGRTTPYPYHFYLLNKLRGLCGIVPKIMA